MEANIFISLELDERELKEIQHSLYYAQNLHHGTVGHNLLMLVGKLTHALGFEVDKVGDLSFGGAEIEGNKIKLEGNWAINEGS